MGALHLDALAVIERRAVLDFGASGASWVARADLGRCSDMVVAISGLHHLGLTVRTVRASAVWYEDVLGFERVGEYASPDGQRQKVFLRHEHLGVRLGLTEHRSGSRDLFDETRVGLDHLAFEVDSETDLFEWQAHLTHQGVRYTPVTPANSIRGAAVLVFRDPDNIQLELFFDPTTG